LSLSIWKYEWRSHSFRALMLVWAAFFCAQAQSSTPTPAPVSVPILAYHRVGPTVADSMTITTAVFEAQLQYLQDNGYTVIPLRSLIDYRLGKAPAPPPRSVVITFDDGHRSVYEVALPLIRKYNVPVTLFIYPSAISNAHAPYAMSWEQLGELAGSGLFDVQSHTYWHPNFKKEKKRLAPDEYRRLVAIQLQKSRAALEKHLATKVDLLAWPFGIYDDELLESAQQAGYAAAFSIDGRQSRDQDRMLALPRYLMNNAQQGKVFAQMVATPAHGLIAAH
jgi:peptidoglycan/xylan/chitin deacetylase (PgdA/CDA1 family)